ncbi:MAG: acetylornithine transaminase [Desulfococcaceae bacterium]
MTKQLMERADAAMAATYARHPLVLERGEGCTVWDTEGRAYTDFIAGIAVCCLGHAHPAVAEAICDQARRLCHVSNLFYTIPQIELAEWLAARCFADRVFFCNSGAEANEAAIKLARRHFHDRGESDRYRIVAAEKSFHGRTLGALSATGQDKIKTGFAPIVEGFDFVPYDDVDALRKAVGPETCAVLLEPVQGEGGVVVPDPDYLANVREICDSAGALLIYDEVQTGVGRTGRLFAHEHSGVAPDIMSLAKALGNGLPIGAMLAREEVAAAFGPGVHATTFGGTPVITAAALAVLKTLESEGIIDRCDRTGRYFRERLGELKEKHSVAAAVRGVGLLNALELTVPGGPVVKAAMERGYLINCIQETVLRFAPPLIVDRPAIDGLVETLDEILKEAAP